MIITDRIAKAFLSVGGLALAGLAAVNFGKVMEYSPAFTNEGRAVGVFGDWHTAATSSLFDRSEYLFQLGFGYVNADTLVSGATEGEDELADLDTSFERADKAVALLEESLRLAPGNAFAWETLSWAYALQGDVEASETALQRSRQLASYSLQLAESRLMLARIAADIRREEAALDPNTSDAVPLQQGIEQNLDDLAVVERYSKEFHEAILASFPELRDLVQPKRE